MLTTTLDQGLQRYAIGEKVRTLRLRKKLGLVELGKHTGLSPALLSKIERGKLHPTLPTLLRIALVFNVGLEFFFAGAREKPACGIVRQAERLTFPDKPGTAAAQYRFQALDYTVPERKLNAYHAEFFAVPAGAVHRHAHPGAEFLYVLSGSLGVEIGEDQHVLDTGDSMYFDSSVPHGYRKTAGRVCRALVITTG